MGHEIGTHVSMCLRHSFLPAAIGLQIQRKAKKVTKCGQKGKSSTE